MEWIGGAVTACQLPNSRVTHIIALLTSNLDYHHSLSSFALCTVLISSGFLSAMQQVVCELSSEWLCSFIWEDGHYRRRCWIVAALAITQY